MQLPFQLVQDAAFQKFKHFIDHDNAPVPRIPNPQGSQVTPRMVPCYCDIQVTAVGMFQAVSQENARRGQGFGNLGRSPFQLILQSVSDPEAKECPTLPAR